MSIGRLCLLFVLVAGCVQSGSVVCGDGRVCPQGTACVDELGLCAREDQLAVCQTGGLAGGESCGNGGVCVGAPIGEACVNCVCVTARCGDGIVTAPEQCDGDALGAAPRCDQHGFYETTDVKCNASCEYDLASSCSATCGDGVLDASHGEQCDDTIDPVEPCAAFGFDAGFASCLAGGCSPNLATCRRIGWTPVVREGITFTAAASTGSHIFVAGIAPASPTLVVWHFDGQTWSQMNTGVSTNANSIYAASPTDIYITGTVGTAGHVVHYDGTTWTVDTFASTATQLVAGSGSSDVLVFGNAGALRHWDGTSWTTGTITGAASARRAVAFSPTDIWFLSSSNKLFHYDGTWTPVTSPLVTAYSIAGVAAALYIVGDSNVYRRDGSVWSLLPGAGGIVERMVGTAANDLYGVGSGLGVIHWNGAYWAAVTPTSFYAIALESAGGQVVAVEPLGTIDRYSGNAWRDSTIASTFPLTSVVSGPTGDVFVVEGGTAVHHIVAGVRTKLALSGVAAAGRAGTDVWVAGSSGLVARWTGSAWASETATGDQYDAIAGPSESVVFAATNAGAIIKRGTSSWTVDSTGTKSLYDLWCGPSICVAVGDGVIKTWTGSTWTTTTAPVWLWGVWGSGPSDVWAVGLSGTVMHYDGSTWTTSRISGEAGTLVSVAGTSSHDVVASTDRGQMYHFDGAHWAPIRLTGSGQSDDLLVTADAIWNVGDDIFGPNGAARTLVLERTNPW